MTEPAFPGFLVGSHRQDGGSFNWLRRLARRFTNGARSDGEARSAPTRAEDLQVICRSGVCEPRCAV